MTDKEKIIDAVLSDFDFEMVYKVMNVLNWKVLYNNTFEVPNIYSLIKIAKELLEEAYTKQTTIETMGFRAEWFKDEKENSIRYGLELKFILTENYAYAN